MCAVLSRRMIEDQPFSSVIRTSNMLLDNDEGRSVTECLIRLKPTEGSVVDRVIAVVVRLAAGP